MSNLRIKPGAQWRHFTYERPGYEFIGIVEQGAGVGALVRCPERLYWQMNGDYQRKLNASAVEKALRRAGAGPTHRLQPSGLAPRTRPEATPVTVIVKRKRQFSVEAMRQVGG